MENEKQKTTNKTVANQALTVNVFNIIEKGERLTVKCC